jgi:hypothetical protein
MALMGQESNYGANTGPSSASAFGVTQFIPGTAKSYGVVPGTSKKAIASQVDGAAKYLRDLGFKKNPQAALSGYSGGYAASAYNNPILSNAKNFKALDAVARGKGSSPYVYPFSKNIKIGRTDQGIDPYGPGKIRAIGKAKYLGVGGSGWPSEGGSGTGPVYKLLKGPMKGKRVYTYEGIAPANLQKGQILHKGQVIAKSVGSSFETGFARGRGAGFQPLASRHPLPASHYSKEGAQFRKFVDSIGGSGGFAGIGGATFSPGGGITAGGTSVAGALPGTVGSTVATRDQQAQARMSSAATTPIRLPFSARAPLPEAFGGGANLQSDTAASTDQGLMPIDSLLATLAGVRGKSKPRRRITL